jgi:drug/metabolite transporter (DMT)-like permease
LPLSALVLALGSAVLHAAWNLLLGRARNVQAATAATFLLSTAIALPFALVWWHADPSVWPWALASTLLEAVYVVALALAYHGSEVSFVYPLTRGLAPVIVLAWSAAVLGHRVSATEAVGVVLIGVGVIGVRGISAGGDARALLLVATLAATIASYTLVDRVGITRAGALTYFVLTLAGPSVVSVPLAGIRAARAEIGLPVLAAALANLGSFVLGLLALRHGSAAAVLAVRSASVVVATALAARVLSEPVSRLRLAGSVVVFAGIALLAL